MKYLSLILWEMQSYQRRPMVMAAPATVGQPPVDTASLPSSHTNKHHCTRHASSGLSHHSSASAPPPP